MNTLKKYLGIFWILLAMAVAYFSIGIFGNKLISDNQEDLVFGIILFFILIPLIVIGLLLFGYYALTDEYNN